ncbi:MAG: T9SS type A sorting domain-containing protein [candidate division Zixibacteria bacterium]|nr:T9SS type A sorting domain-containing protein [candidate division Zixibacteria bacterium]
MSSAKFCLALALIVIVAIPLTAQEIDLISTTLWTGVNNIVVIDNYAYCAFVTGLKIIDFNNPQQPVEIGKSFLDGETMKLAIDGDYAYVAGSKSGLQIVDISQPENPQLVYTFSTAGDVQDVVIRGDFAYLADKNKGLYVIDILDPEQPVEVLNWNDDYVISVFIQDHYLYATCRPDGLLIFDLSIPDSPELISFTEIVDNAEDVFVDGDFAYINNSWELGLLIYNIADPYLPVFMGSYEEFFEDMWISDNYAYIATYSADLIILDVTDPTNPTYIGGYAAERWSQALCLVDNTVYLGTNYYGIDCIDVSVPDQIEHIGTFTTPQRIFTVNKQDDYLYAGGFHIVDDSDPYNPIVMGGITLPEWTRDIYLTENYAYVVSGDNSLNIIDITNPLEPEIIGAYVAPSYMSSVEVSGDFAYITVSQNGIHIVDISDPGQPVYYSEYLMPGIYIDDIFIRGNYAFIANSHPGMVILDISNPANPAFVSSYQASSSCNTIFVRENLVFMASNLSYHIVDISDINNPSHIISWGTQDHAYDIWSDGHYAYMADMDLWIVDISDLPNVYSVARHPTPGWATEVFVDGEQVYIADRNSLMIFQFSPTDIEDDELLIPDRYRLSQNYPNPFNASSIIRYEVAKSSRVNLEIYDLLGRQVATLVNREQQAGYHQVVWNADDFPSGIYFYKLQAGEYIETKMMTLLK